MLDDPLRGVGLIVPPFRDPIGAVLDRIQTGLQLTQEGWGNEFGGLKQPAVSVMLSDFKSGKRAPSETEMQDLRGLYFRASAASWGIKKPLYLCDLENVRHSQPVEKRIVAQRAIEEKLGLDGQHKLDHLVETDLYLRSASFSDNALCHCFGNDSRSPDVFVVLLNDTLSYPDQLALAWQMAFRHVARRTIPSRASLIGEVKMPAARTSVPVARPYQSRAGLSAWVSRALGRTQNASHLSQIDLAPYFEMSQPGFHRHSRDWKQGIKAPTQQQLRILESLYFKACCRTLGVSTLVHLFTWPEDFAPPPNLSIESFCDVLYLGKDWQQATAPNASTRKTVRIDIHIRKAGLAPSVRAHCFGNNWTEPGASDVFVVLTNGNGCSQHEQDSTAWDEVSAHIVQRPFIGMPLEVQSLLYRR